MPSYDLLVYRDLSTEEELAEGDAATQLGDEFEGMRIVVVGPPIHPTKDATAVVMHRADATPELRRLLGERQTGD